MTKDFDIIDLDDEKTSKFAEVMKNPTSKRIWQFLKRNRASQKRISEKLNIPLPTVHYNLERLMASGLVEIEDYYWSPKGNKVHIYRASKKVMVFTPEKTPYLEQHMKAILSVAIVLIGVIVIVAFQGTSIWEGDKGSVISNNFNKNLQRFDSEESLLEIIKGIDGPQGDGFLVAEGLAGSDSSSAKTASSLQSELSGSDFSTTNIQVQGVDEADVIKTDGEYIYLVSNGNFLIVRARPAKEAEILSTIELKNFYANEIFIEKDRVLVFGFEEDQGYGVAEDMGFSPRGEFAQVRLFDTSNKLKPEQLRTVEFEGNYLSSRKVGSDVYFVINSYPRYDLREGCLEIVPLYADVKGSEETKNERKAIAECTEIGYIEPIQARSFITIASISMSDEDRLIEKETILGNVGAVYASESSFYIAQRIYPNYGFRAMGAAVLDADLAEADIGESVKIEEIKKEKIEKKPSTVVTKFNLEKGKIDFQGTGKVMGHLLNQFSMDEYDGNFRIATTLREYGGVREDISNNLYVLDENLIQIGKIENIAPGEQIYSARFIGEKAYLVTFEQVDPLFVIDLSNPRKPDILGKLKIPGFSNYLHPIGEGYLLGIGQEVEQTKGGRFITTGVKIAIFDVRDVENPKEVHKEVLGGRHSSTIAQYDHKAVLFDEERGLFVLPVTLTEGGDGPSDYLSNNFQGAYVYNVDVKDGFDLKGNVSHYTSEEEKKFGDYYYGYEISRSLYIGDVLYTMSSSRLQSNSLTSLEKIKSLEISEGIKRMYAAGRIESFSTGTTGATS